MHYEMSLRVSLVVMADNRVEAEAKIREKLVAVQDLGFCVDTDPDNVVFFEGDTQLHLTEKGYQTHDEILAEWREQQKTEDVTGIA